ncbi:MAG TPA: A24 family peptidase [Stenotrophobium sp.]|nr:A24 family peptidase [Stenotrophobium sp.]
MIDLLSENSVALILVTVLLGLIVGSFLNVVILRLPRMMELAWKRECREILELPAVETEPLSLMSPPSRCPQCAAPVRAWQNIPVISWLLLRGRCATCATSISVQYPLVEVSTALLSAVCAWKFGWSGQLAGALVLTWALVTLAAIDLRTQLLPDSITLPLLWLGLALGFFPVFASLHDAVLGAIAGYLSLWSVFHVFRLLTGKEGMGHGDFKLFAALGAWLGWQCLPQIILLASVVGAVVGLSLIVLQRQGKEIPIAFGPYLAAAGWIALIWGHSITAAYLGASGLG